MGLSKRAKLAGPREDGLTGEGVAFVAASAGGGGTAAEAEEDEDAPFMMPANGLRLPLERNEEVRVCSSSAEGTAGVGGGF